LRAGGCGGCRSAPSGRSGGCVSRATVGRGSRALFQGPGGARIARVGGGEGGGGAEVFRRGVLGDDNDRMQEKVSSSGVRTGPGKQAAPSNAQDGRPIGPRRNGDGDRAVGRGDGHPRTSDRLGDGQRQVEVQVVVLDPRAGGQTNAETDQQVAGMPVPCFRARTGHAEQVTVPRPRRDVERHATLDPQHAATGTLWAVLSRAAGGRAAPAGNLEPQASGMRTAAGRLRQPDVEIGHDVRDRPTFPGPPSFRVALPPAPLSLPRRSAGRRTQQGLHQEFELLLRLKIARSTVRMNLAGPPPKGTTHLLRRSTRSYAQHGPRIPAHASSRTVARRSRRALERFDSPGAA